MDRDSSSNLKLVTLADHLLLQSRKVHKRAYHEAAVQCSESGFLEPSLAFPWALLALGPPSRCMQHLFVPSKQNSPDLYRMSPDYTQRLPVHKQTDVNSINNKL